MPNYTLTLLLNSDLDESARRQLLDAIVKQFDKLEKEDLWGNKGLAYPIKHHDKAFYAHYQFQAEPQKISSLDKMIKLNEDILRYLLIRR